MVIPVYILPVLAVVFFIAGGIVTRRKKKKDLIVSITRKKASFVLFIIFLLFTILSFVFVPMEGTVYGKPFKILTTTLNEVMLWCYILTRLTQKIRLLQRINDFLKAIIQRSVSDIKIQSIT